MRSGILSIIFVRMLCIRRDSVRVIGIWGDSIAFHTFLVKNKHTSSIWPKYKGLAYAYLVLLGKRRICIILNYISQIWSIDMYTTSYCCSIKEKYEDLIWPKCRVWYWCICIWLRMTDTLQRNAEVYFFKPEAAMPQKTPISKVVTFVTSEWKEIRKIANKSLSWSIVYCDIAYMCFGQTVLVTH